MGAGVTYLGVYVQTYVEVLGHVEVAHALALGARVRTRLPACCLWCPVGWDGVRGGGWGAGIEGRSVKGSRRGTGRQLFEYVDDARTRARTYVLTGEDEDSRGVLGRHLHALADVRHQRARQVL